MSNAWDEAAEIRATQIESGHDLTFTRVFLPYYRELLSELMPMSLLDVGCGTGHLLSELQGQVPVACGLDPSEGMIATASRVLENADVSLFCTSVEDFLGSDKYDLIISHLCIQCVEDLHSFFSAVAQLISPNGKFVFSLPHPCFWNDYTGFIARESFVYLQTQSVTATLTVQGEKVANVPYVHRPLREYFAGLNRSGFRVLLLDEIYPKPEVERLYPSPWRTPRFAVIQCELPASG